MKTKGTTKRKASVGSKGKAAARKAGRGTARGAGKANARGTKKTGTAIAGRKKTPRAAKTAANLL